MRDPDTCWLALDECLWVTDVLYVEGYDLNVYNIRVSAQTSTCRMPGMQLDGWLWPLSWRDNLAQGLRTGCEHLCAVWCHPRVLDAVWGMHRCFLRYACA